ncbi:hypothetical protein ABLO16_07930, partial [Mycobacterium tuberculosis]
KSARTSFRYQIWVFNLNQEGKARCFRIYRETLSRFSCAASSTRCPPGVSRPSQGAIASA